MSREYYEFFCPVKIVAGYRALEHMAYELSSRGCERPLLVTDQGVAGAGLSEGVRAALVAGGVTPAAEFDAVPPDSSLAAVKAAARAYREADCDSLVAVGGGSVMDTAKAVNILVTEGGDDLRRYTGANNLPKRLRPFVAVPTTSGTGSEVTSVTIIKDEQAGAKLPVLSQFLLPDVAVLDPRMTARLPPRITAATALDALTHAMESYTCLAKNPMSDAYAAAAIGRVGRWLVPVLEHPGDETGRLALAQAATMAGIAFSNSMVGIVHALGHAVGAIAGVHHGTCMGIFLPVVLEFNLDVRRQEIGELLLHLEGPEAYARVAPGERGEAAVAAVGRLKDRVHELCGLPRTLSETGQVSREDFPRLARVALDDGTTLYNPVEASYEDALALLEKAW